MKRINPDKMSRTELDRLGAEAERVTYRDTRPLTPDAHRALTAVLCTPSASTSASSI